MFRRPPLLGDPREERLDLARLPDVERRENRRPIFPFDTGRGTAIVTVAPPSLRLEQAPRVARDHELFVGRDRPGAHPAARRADSGPAPFIGRRVEREPEPPRITADALADRRRVLTDPGRKHDGVEPAQGAGLRYT